MSHNSGFIIGITHVFAKILIEHTPKTCLKSINPLVSFCHECRSTSMYQVKREYPTAIYYIKNEPGYIVEKPSCSAFKGIVE